MKPKDIKAVYFIGAGGIGMSAIARYFIKKGLVVAGYDKTPSELTQQLEKEGMLLHYEESVTEIPYVCKDPRSCLVIYTPAIPESHQELAFFRANGFEIEKRAQVLGTLTCTHKGLCFAGTHGKTTTSAMCAHIMHQSHLDCNAFLGGISKNYGTNYILSDHSDYVVIEADEFDRSFLRLSPSIACITAVDADHLDIYGTAEEFQKGFEDFNHRLKPGGKLIVRKGLPFAGLTYGIADGSDYEISQVKVQNGGYHFSLSYTDPKTGQHEEVKDCTLFRPGEHHLLNALAAVAVAHQAGYPLADLTRALASFKGVKRRFSYIINTPEQVFIDDYAHHPTELNALYNGVRTMYPNEEITILFQPHLFTRTRDFADGFAKSLSQFDRVVLLDIYPARELPIEGVTSQWLLDKIENPNKVLLSKSEIINYLQAQPARVLVLAGAGDIGVEVEKIKKFLEKDV